MAPKQKLVTNNWFIAHKIFNNIFKKQIEKEEEELKMFIYKNAHINNGTASLFYKDIQVNLSGLIIKPKDYTKVHNSLSDELNRLAKKLKYTHTQRDKVEVYLKYAAMFKEGDKFIGFEDWVSKYIPSEFKGVMLFNTKKAKQISIDYEDEINFCKETIVWGLFE